MTTLAILVHWVHVAGALVWVGAQTFFYAALWPALLGRPAADARAMLGAIMPRAARFMGPSAILVVLTGLLRGTWLGNVRSLGALATPYGITFLVSLLLVAGLMVHGGRLRTTLGARVFDGADYRPGAQAFLRAQGRIVLGALGTVLACMVLMRFGL